MAVLPSNQSLEADLEAFGRKLGIKDLDTVFDVEVRAKMVTLLYRFRIEQRLLREDDVGIRNFSHTGNCEQNFFATLCMLTELLMFNSPITPLMTQLGINHTLYSTYNPRPASIPDAGTPHQLAPGIRRCVHP